MMRIYSVKTLENSLEGSVSLFAFVFCLANKSMNNLTLIFNDLKKDQLHMYILNNTVKPIKGFLFC